MQSKQTAFCLSLTLSLSLGKLVSYKPVYRNDSIYDVQYLFMCLNVEKLQKHVTSAGSWS